MIFGKIFKEVRDKKIRPVKERIVRNKIMKFINVQT